MPDQTNVTGGLGSSWHDQITQPPPVANAADPQFIVSVKKAVMQALRATFTADYPDPILRNINVHMEYPAEQEDYPGIWVQFSFRDLQAEGINHKVYYDDVNNRRWSYWMFGGTVTLMIVALTSKERDTIADKVIQMYAFHSLNIQANQFTNTLMQWPYINIALNNDALRPSGQSTTVGAPWQPDVLVYEDSYSFDILGQFASDFPTGELIRLDEIRLLPYLQGQPSTRVDDGNGEWQNG
jgi:hypothetical protein